MKIKHVADGVNGYVDVVRWVLENGEEASPRGMKTREIEDAVIFIDDVFNTLPLGVKRGTVPGIGSVEALQLLAGVSVPNLVTAIGPQFANYAENNGLFHGAYGLRTRGQYEHVIERLKSDPDTRQAVVTIWDPKLDLQPKKRDYPCTVLHQFRIRNNRLNMSVYMRSNDVWLGAAYDWFQFTRVQIAMASVLGVEPGTYAHHVGSLHIYEQNFDAAAQLEYTQEGIPVPYITGRIWQEVAGAALSCLKAVTDQPLYDRLQEHERWFTDSMVKAIRSNQEKALAAEAAEKESTDGE
jgi:thymidylate synthase